MSWYDSLVNGQRARVKEESDGQIRVLFNFTGESDHSPHDEMITTPDGTNVEYWRENGIDRIDASNANNAYPDTPHRR